MNTCNRRSNWFLIWIDIKSLFLSQFFLIILNSVKANRLFISAREAPILELYPQDIQTVILGGSADLQCRAKAGVPVPELRWSRQDNRPFASNIEQLPGGLLRLSNITVHDGGAYICSASNEVGSTSVIAHIEVQSMPVITITPKHGILQVKRGSRVRLMCSASGHPQPNVAWSKHVNGITIQ